MEFFLFFILCSFIFNFIISNQKYLISNGVESTFNLGPERLEFDITAIWRTHLSILLREVSLILLRPPVILTWSDRLYINGELVQVQSGGLDLKSSLLRFCNTFLWLNSLVVKGVVDVYGLMLEIWRIVYLTEIVMKDIVNANSVTVRSKPIVVSLYMYSF